MWNVCEKFGNRRGSTLVGVMIQATLISMLMVGLMDRATIMMKASKTVESQGQITNFTAQIDSMIRMEGTCNVALKNQNINGEIQVMDPITNPRVFAKQGDVHDGIWKVESIRMTDVQEIVGLTKVKRGVLTVKISKDAKFVIGQKEITKTIGSTYFETTTDPALIFADPSGAPAGGEWITRCFGADSVNTSLAQAGQSSALTACDAVPEAWMTTTKIGFLCTLKARMVAIITDLRDRGATPAEVDAVDLCGLMNINSEQAQFLGLVCKVQAVVKGHDGDYVEHENGH